MSDKNFDNLVDSQDILKGIYLYGLRAFSYPNRRY